MFSDVQLIVYNAVHYSSVMHGIVPCNTMCIDVPCFAIQCRVAEYDYEAHLPGACSSMAWWCSGGRKEGRRAVLYSREGKKSAVLYSTVGNEKNMKWFIVEKGGKDVCRRVYYRIEGRRCTALYSTVKKKGLYIKEVKYIPWGRKDVVLYSTLGKEGNVQGCIV